jgi:hypothetical protein
MVMDSLRGHFGSSDLTVFVEELIKRAKNGVFLVIADAVSFFHLNKTDKLMEHELLYVYRYALK